MSTGDAVRDLIRVRQSHFGAVRGADAIADRAARPAIAGATVLLKLRRPSRTRVKPR